VHPSGGASAAEGDAGEELVGVDAAPEITESDIDAALAEDAAAEDVGSEQ
jgi:hypothetical protein